MRYWRERSPRAPARWSPLRRPTDGAWDGWSTPSAIIGRSATRSRRKGSSSPRRISRTGLFPVHEQEPARRVELRLAWSGKNLQLQLFDLVLGAIPAGQREIAVPPGARQQHHVHHRVVG